MPAVFRMTICNYLDIGPTVLGIPTLNVLQSQVLSMFCLQNPDVLSNIS